LSPLHWHCAVILVEEFALVELHLDARPVLPVLLVGADDRVKAYRRP
jgi:hypothetical protein